MKVRNYMALLNFHSHIWQLQSRPLAGIERCPTAISPVGNLESKKNEDITRLPFLLSRSDSWFEIEPFDEATDIANLIRNMKSIASAEAQKKFPLP